jgi:hypothetical protein
MGNPLALLALVSWPLISLILFRRLPLERALVWCLLGGYLFLPPVVQINFPAIPAFDKMSIPSLSAYVICAFVLGHKIPLMPESWVGKVLLALFVFSPFGTVLTNPEIIPVNFRPDLPGMRLYDALSIVSYQMYVIMTFAMARRFLANAQALREILYALVISSLIYSIPMLIEIRLSPQINVWVYGFFQHSFEQMMRSGGFRPIVFLEHGLWVAFYAVTAILAATHLTRERSGKARMKMGAITLYLFVVLALCKSLGSFIFAVLLMPMVFFLPLSWLIVAAAGMAFVALGYPIFRGSNIVPVAQMLEFFNSIDPKRAQSLEFRFVNEAKLLAHAMEKPVFGWGGWLRNLLHDPLTGRVATIADGQWIVTITLYGWAGFLAEFGLLALPLFLFLPEVLRSRSLPPLEPALGALVMIHGINMIDMLPNATLTPLTWMICGALLGHAEVLARARKGRRQEDVYMMTNGKTII